jgi:hypothetical protein
MVYARNRNLAEKSIQESGRMIPVDKIDIYNEAIRILPAITQKDFMEALAAIKLVEEKIIGRHCGDLGDKLLQYLTIVHFVHSTKNKKCNSIEIGTLFGGSCLMKLMAMRNLGVEGKVVCIDPMAGFYDKEVDIITKLPVAADTFFKNIELFGFSGDSIELRTMKSNDSKALRGLRKRSFATLMIDGNHSYKGVRDDWDCYYPLMRKEGVVLFDDYKEPAWPEITTFVDELKKELPEGWKELGALGTTLLVARSK